MRGTGHILVKKGGGGGAPLKYLATANAEGIGLDELIYTHRVLVLATSQSRIEDIFLQVFVCSNSDITKSGLGGTS